VRVEKVRSYERNLQLSKDHFMNYFRGGLAILLVPLLLLSTSCTQRQLVKPDVPKEYVCSDEAFLVVKDYELTEPPKDDKGFEMWQADGLTSKYPQLLFGYRTLLDCWMYYHPKGEK
jgi:hypothetical protein